MDRDLLVKRNIRLTELRHQPSFKQGLRDSALNLLSIIPVVQQKSDGQRLLIIRPDHLGDVLLTTPAIQLLKRRRPELEIHVLCGPWAADLLAAYEEIDQVLTLSFPGFRRSPHTKDRNPMLQLLHSARMLRKIGYGSAMIMRPDHWWGAMLSYAAGIPVRIGYQRSGVAPFLTKALPHWRQHAVYQSFHLAQAWLDSSEAESPVLKYPAAASDRQWVASHLSGKGLDDRADIICIHAGSGAESKLWRNDKWAEAADLLAEELHASIIFTGTAEEAQLIDDILQRMSTRALNLAGETTIGQSAALFRRSCLVLGTDNGAMHLAAAVHTPTVTLFGPADPIEFAPWGNSQKHALVISAIGCRPCRILDWRGDNPELHPCVREIEIEQVLSAVRQVLQSRREST